MVETGITTAAGACLPTMPISRTTARFKTTLLAPARPGKDRSWAFLVLPKSASDKLPRRGRTTVAGTLNGHAFQATLEPDGQLSHWLKVDKQLCEEAGIAVGDTVTLTVVPVQPEPEPQLPADFGKALAASAKALATWEDTTTLARVDWIHWVVSAKQQKTREKRIRDACGMLASGKRRVCCFDESGFYSKSLRAPEASD